MFTRHEEAIREKVLLVAKKDLHDALSVLNRSYYSGWFTFEAYAQVRSEILLAAGVATR